MKPRPLAQPSDLDEGGNIEPSLGVPDHMTNQTQIGEGSASDVEDERDGREPENDNEPSLGSLDW